MPHDPHASRPGVDPMMLVSLALAAALLATSARAQTASGTATASATVISPLVLSVASDLAFGKLAQGTSKTRGTNGAATARFSVTGQGASSVSVTLTLPTSLAQAADLLPIGSWKGTADVYDGNNMSAFTPVSGAAVTRTLPGTADDATERYHYRLGGTVTAAPAQPLGVYTGTVTITAAYTGI